MTYAEFKPDLRGRIALPIQAQRLGLPQRQPPGHGHPFKVDQVFAAQSLTAYQKNDFHRLGLAQLASLAQVVPLFVNKSLMLSFSQPAVPQGALARLLWRWPVPPKIRGRRRASTKEKPALLVRNVQPFGGNYVISER